MGNSSTKGQGQYPSITTLQRELFEERWRSTLAKKPSGGEVVHPIFTELPLTLGAALTQILYARVSGRGQSGLKAELLNLLNSAVTFDLADLVIALHSEAGLSLTELAGQVSKLFLSMWGEPLSQSEQGTAAFRDLLLLSHWRPGQLEVEDQYIIEWLNCCKQNNIDAKRLEGWISTNHQFQNVFSVVIKRALLGPSAIDDADFSAPLVVGGTLNAALCWLVMKNVPVDCHSTWNLRYASKVHGASWNAFRRAVTKAGPSIIVIRERVKSGIPHTFGAFSYVDWATCPKFFGDGKSFLFTTYPQLKAYHPTGYNSNFQYFNHGVQTLPNGLGLGGQLEYFGLWIDHSFEWGCSNANPKCSTYASPCLSQNERFYIDQVEVWSLKPPEEEDSELKASILDCDPEAAALLEMANRPMYSQGLREPISDDES